MDASRLRAILAELYDRLSDEDWERVHFYLGADPSPTANRSLMGSLFEQDKVNEEHFNFLLSLFEKNQCHNAVEFLKERWKPNQSNTLNQVTGNLLMILPPRINNVVTNDQFISKTVSDLVFNHQQSTLGSKIVHTNRMPTVICHQRTTGTELKINKEFKLRAMRWRCLLPIVLLSIIVYGIFVSFSVLMNTNDVRHLKTSDSLFEERIQQLEKIPQWQDRLKQLEGKKIVVHQLNRPTDVIVDKQDRSLIICDRRNRRVTRLLYQNGTWRGETIINDIACYGLAKDHEGSLYVTDTDNHLVRRYRWGETSGMVVAGGNGKGAGLNQLSNPHRVFVDEDQAVYVLDSGNHRVTKWAKGAAQGGLVADGEGWMQLPSLVGFSFNRQSRE